MGHFIPLGFLGTPRILNLATVVTSGTAINTPTTALWTCPAYVTSVFVECIGAGGTGRARSTAGICGGGGGGAYASATIATVPGQTYTISAGGGGLVGTVNGTNTPSRFIHFDGTTNLVYAAQGTPGDTAGIGGLGGQASSCIGDIKYSGGTGGNGTLTVSGGGGGGAAGPSGNGGNASGRTAGNGTGDWAPSGNGGIGNTVGSGILGGNYGGGGGGGMRTTTGTSNNQTGGRGIVRLSYYI